MKDFLERYGLLAAVGVFVLILIIMISPLGTKIKTVAEGVVSDFKETEIYKAIQKQKTSIEVIPSEEDGYFDVVVISKKEDAVWDLYYQYKDSSGWWSGYEDLHIELSTGSTSHSGSFYMRRAEPGTVIQVKAYDSYNDEEVISEEYTIPEN